MQSRREIASNTVFLLRSAAGGRVFINKLEKSSSRSVLYTIGYLLKRNLLIESIERDERDIPRVALLPTERGRAFLKKIEGMKRPDPAAVITV